MECSLQKINTKPITSNIEQAKSIIRFLGERQGFECWWNDIHEDDKAEILARIQARFTTHTQSLEDVCEMWLCEQRFLALKPNQLYRFTVDENCDACKALRDEGKTP
jgi:hypothetical protein